MWKFLLIKENFWSFSIVWKSCDYKLLHNITDVRLIPKLKKQIEMKKNFIYLFSYYD